MSNVHKLPVGLGFQLEAANTLDKAKELAAKVRLDMAKHGVKPYNSDF